jgi:hypothetical protein
MRLRHAAPSIVAALLGCSVPRAPARAPERAPVAPAVPSGLERVTVWVDGARCLF